ncbi:hypothetical protein BKA70DRAFT_1107976 [Coprinopsis sp. MPI-PUGE-AT-0042]|nr:hypothetical protein BKA70DRAFT_1107976 [Coprinopsis sp. MPI-PUGE-AT-0042]
MTPVVQPVPDPDHQSRAARSQPVPVAVQLTSGSSKPNASTAPGTPHADNKDKARSYWMPFDSEEEALQWACKLPDSAAGKLMKALSTDGTVTHPPPVAPYLKWSPPDEERGETSDVRMEDGDKGGSTGDGPESMKTVFESLPAHWRASLKASVEESREFAGFQAGMISSAAIESQLIYLQRWLLTLVNHYQRNLELSAGMTTQMGAVNKGLKYRRQDIDIIAVISGENKAAGGNKE